MAPDRVRNVDGNLRTGGTADKHPENCGYSLPTMPGGRGQGGRGLQTPDDGGRTGLPVEAMVTSTMTRLQEGFSKGSLAAHRQTQNSMAIGGGR